MQQSLGQLELVKLHLENAFASFSPKLNPGTLLRYFVSVSMNAKSEDVASPTYYWKKGSTGREDGVIIR